MARARCHRPEGFRCGQKRGEDAGDMVRVGLDKFAVDPGLDKVFRAIDLCRHDGEPAGCRLNRSQAEGLVVAGKEKKIRRRHGLRHGLAEATEGHPRPAIRRQLFEAFAVRIVPRHKKPCVHFAHCTDGPGQPLTRPIQPPEKGKSDPPAKSVGGPPGAILSAGCGRKMVVSAALGMMRTGDFPMA